MSKYLHAIIPVLLVVVARYSFPVVEAEISLMVFFWAGLVFFLYGMWRTPSTLPVAASYIGWRFMETGVTFMVAAAFITILTL